MNSPKTHKICSRKKKGFNGLVKIKSTANHYVFSPTSTKSGNAPAQHGHVESEWLLLWALALLAIWLEMASGDRNWDGFLIGNGWLTGKTWEKWSVPNVYHSKWSLQRICHTGWPGLKVTKGVGKAMAARKIREAVGTWKCMISWLVRFKSDTFWVHNRPSKPHHLAESLENIGHADDLTCLEDLVASSCVSCWFTKVEYSFNVVQ